MKKKKQSAGGVIIVVILVLIFGQYWKIICTVLAIAFLGLILWSVYKVKEEKSQKVSSMPSSSKQPTTSTHAELQKETISRQMTIYFESTELISSSNNLDTVLHRYSTICNTLNKLSSFTDAEIKNAGYELPQSFSSILDYIETNKNPIINQAIERNVRHELDKLDTTDDKMKKLVSLYNKINRNTKLEKDNLTFTENLYHKIRNELLGQENHITLGAWDSQKGTDPDEPETKYVEISTSGDENVCPMCAQFEGKIFPADHAPELPLCPLCSCAYMYYFSQNELPPNAEISNIDDFTLPSEHTPMFYDTQHKAYDETDIMKCIRICERQLKKLPEFMEPYISAKFSVPELACRDLLPDLYMQIGKWEKAEKAIKACIDAGAYYPEDGSAELAHMNSYHKVAIDTLSYISKNPGCLQRNIYNAMGYEGTEREILKEFLRNSELIRKEKYKNTNQLFCIEEITKGNN